MSARPPVAPDVEASSARALRQLAEDEPADNNDGHGQQPAAGLLGPFFQRVKNHDKPSSPIKDVIPGWVRIATGRSGF